MWFHLYKGPRIGKSIETENKIEVTRAEGKGEDDFPIPFPGLIPPTDLKWIDAPPFGHLHM